MFHETLHVSLSEQLRHEWLWSESFQIVKVFTSTKEDDRCLGRCDTACQHYGFSRPLSLRRDSSTTLGMTIELRYDDGTKVCTILESL
jgi:hypothetical protein